MTSRLVAIAFAALMADGAGHVAAQSATPPSRPMPSASAIGRFSLNTRPVQGGYLLGQVPRGTQKLNIDGRSIEFAADGVFAVGYGRDYAGETLITAVLANGQRIEERLPVARWPWRIESLPTLPKRSQPSAEFAARRPGELAQINAARRIASDSSGWRQRFIWPARGRISGLFGSQRIYAGEPGAPHSGVDVAGPVGAPVIAPADGVVTLAATRPFTLEGNLLMIDHGMGLNSAFLHLSRIDVRAGDRVQQGQRVGSIGATGRTTGPHLHWGMKWHDERIDPQRLAGAMR